MTLFGVLLVLALGVGVVQASRDREGENLLSGWIGTPERPQASAPGSREPEPGPGPAREGETSAAEPAVLAAGDLSVLEGGEAEPMVRYFDAAGSLHMVRGLERVPPQHRADAVVVGRGNVNVVSVPAPTAVAFRDWQPESNPNRSSVVLFSASWCGACKRARQHLDELGVAYQERDIDADADAKEEVRRVLGRVAIPLLDVDGRYISGFRPDVYDRALGRV